VYPLLLFSLGLGFGALAALPTAEPMWARALLSWPAVAFLVVASAYVLRRPLLLGKRADGTIHPIARLFFAPFALFAWASWHGYRLATSEDACNEVAPGVWLGRRPFARDLPATVTVVVDLTAELVADHAVRTGRTYVCLPALDASVPDTRAFELVLARLVDEPGGVFIHCAFGHGRSAMLAAALLVRRGLARDVAEAEALLRARRPRVSLKGAQRAYVERTLRRPGTMRSP